MFAAFSELAPLPQPPGQAREEVVDEDAVNDATASPASMENAQDANDQNQADANEQGKVIETGGSTNQASDPLRF